MCLILLSLEVQPEFPLILAANRDEYYARPTEAAHLWEDGVLAGRDLRSGGTWLGWREGRWAAVTNYRETEPTRDGAPSRGQLVLKFLRGQQTPAEFLSEIAQSGQTYAGFNLLFGVETEVFSTSNRGPGEQVGPGVHGLSNHLLNTPWPKVVAGREALRASGDGLDTLEWLREDSIPPGDGPLGAVFIRTPEYGTRCSTLLRRDSGGGWLFVERRYRGLEWEESHYQM